MVPRRCFTILPSLRHPSRSYLFQQRRVKVVVAKVHRLYSCGGRRPHDLSRQPPWYHDSTIVSLRRGTKVLLKEQSVDDSLLVLVYS